jgi:transposase-like protein
MTVPKRARRHFTAEEKAKILRRHLADKTAISDLAEEHGLQPSVLYQWLRQLLDHAAEALQPQRGKSDRADQVLAERIRFLEARVIKKESVIAALSEELVKTKKELGEL